MLFRKIDRGQPTLLLDEIDTLFGKDPSMMQGIRGILNAGYRIGGKVSRCVPPDFDAEDFSVFCPKAFAGIGDALPDTTADRSIPIVLRRRAPTERKPERFRLRRATAELEPLAQDLRDWADEARRTLGSLEPDLPDELNDRAQDAWEVLLAIVDLAGGTWSEQARTAAIALQGEIVDKDVGVLLLGHVREAFELAGSKKVSTEDSAQPSRRPRRRFTLGSMVGKRGRGEKIQGARREAGADAQAVRNHSADDAARNVDDGARL